MYMDIHHERQQLRVGYKGSYLGCMTEVCFEEPGEGKGRSEEINGVNRDSQAMEYIEDIARG